MLISKFFQKPLFFLFSPTLHKQHYSFFMTTKPNLYKFSIKNYMKPINPQHITSRIHGRIRIDQNATLFTTPQQIQQFITKQQSLYTQYSKNWQYRTKQYLDQVNSRKSTITKSTGQLHNNFQYYTTVSWYKGRQYTKIWRKSLHQSKSQSSQLVLDIMKYHQINKYYNTVELVKTVISHDQKLIAFGFDLHNNQQISFMIKNIQLDTLISVQGWQKNRLKGIDMLLFTKTNNIFYTKTIQYRPSQLWYQNIKTGTSQLIYQQKNKQYYLDILLTKNQKYIIINSNSKQHSKIFIINIYQQQKYNILNLKSIFQLKQFNIWKKGVKIYINHNGKYFVVWKSGQENNQIVLVNQQNLNIEIPLFKLPQNQPTTITDIDIFQNYIVLYLRKIVTPLITILQLKDQSLLKTTQLPLPYKFGSIHPGLNHMLNPPTFLFYLNNIFIYNEGYQCNLLTKNITLKQQFKMSGPKFNQTKYTVSFHQVPSLDGQFIPLTTIIPKKQNKRNKMILHCYGHYGLTYDINFNSTYWAALQNGWSLAYAHIRGGGEKGHSWHTAAIKSKKYKNWTDLQDCAAYLVKHQYTHPNILILNSHSAGAITIWNTINRYPHLFKAVIMSYPFLDVLGLLLDKNKPLAQSDYSEFGNPNQNITTYNQIQSYSPYQNIHQRKKYPFIYLIAGKADYRCPMDQIAKFVKRYRELRTWQQHQQRFDNIGQKGLLVKVNQGSHQGVADLSEQLKNGCEILACLDYLIIQSSRDVSVNK